jgi:hypothetical protein
MIINFRLQPIFFSVPAYGQSVILWQAHIRVILLGLKFSTNTIMMIDFTSIITGLLQESKVWRVVELHFDLF